MQENPPVLDFDVTEADRERVLRAMNAQAHQGYDGGINEASACVQFFIRLQKATPLVAKTAPKPVKSPPPDNDPPGSPA